MKDVLNRLLSFFKQITENVDQIQSTINELEQNQEDPPNNNDEGGSVGNKCSGKGKGGGEPTEEEKEEMRRRAKVNAAMRAAKIHANANPWHDKGTGQFTSGPGGAGGGAGGVVQVPSFYLKSSVVTKSVEIDDEGASFSATLSSGSIKSGPNKGKYQAYIKSHDMGGEFISRKLYTSDSELRKEINFDKISYDKMIESFKRM